MKSHPDQEKKYQIERYVSRAKLSFQIYIASLLCWILFVFLTNKNPELLFTLFLWPYMALVNFFYFWPPAIFYNLAGPAHAYFVRFYLNSLFCFIPIVSFILMVYFYQKGKKLKSVAKVLPDAKHELGRLENESSTFPTLFKVVAGIITLIFGLGLAFVFLLAGAGWGRPLRIRGKVVHAELDPGDDWIDGESPNIEGLDEDTAEALEGLWYHDAKKEHASVPAFARLTWNLTAVGAPPELLRRIQVAAIEEIAHTQKCLALAAGFRGRAKTFADFPQLLNEMNDVKGKPEVHLARESLLDGCLLEEFNADIAASGAKVCQDQASKRLLIQIAKEERSHAALSWDIVQFLADKSPEVVAMLRREIGRLDRVSRPTVSTKETFQLVTRANPDLLLKYGRLPDEQWEKMWKRRLKLVHTRLAKMIGETHVENISA